MVYVDVIEFITLTLRGFCDSFHGFLYVPILLIHFIRKCFGKKPIEDKGDYDTQIVEALKTACLYNLIFTAVMLPVVYVFIPSCNYILSQTMSADSVSTIKTFSYHFGLVFRIIPVQIYKAGHFYLFQDIAKLVHIKKKGKPQEWGSIQVRLSDTVFNLIVQMVYGGQLMIISILLGMWSVWFPSTRLNLLHSEDLVQFIIINVFTSIWYSLCLFEYKWYFLAWNLHRRLAYIEKNWPYFVSFSFIYAVITTQLDSYCLNALIAGMLFPFFLFSVYEAEPQESVGISPVPFFQPSVAVTNTLIRMLNRKS